MKFTYLIIFTLFFFSTFAQVDEKIVVLMDSEFETPIEGATITILRTNQGLISNKDGIFKINLKRVSYIEISHTFYKTIKISSATLKDKENIVYMEGNVNNLEEVIITKEDPQNILKAIIEKSRSKITVPANLKVYSREFFKKNDVYTFYNDGLLNFQILEDNDKIKTDILIEQNRSVGLLNEFDKSILGYNLNDLMENYYAFNYIQHLTESRAKKLYSFQIKSYSQNDDYNYLVVKPLTSVKGEFSQYAILYDYKSKLIMEISSYLPSDRVTTDRSFFDFQKKNIYKSEFKTTYRYENHKYYLANSVEEIGFYVYSNKKEIKMDVKNYFVVTEFRSKVFKYKPEEIFKEKSLINKKNSILTDFWNVDSGLVLTKPEIDIINSLAQ